MLESVKQQAKAFGKAVDLIVFLSELMQDLTTLPPSLLMARLGMYRLSPTTRSSRSIVKSKQPLSIVLYNARFLRLDDVRRKQLLKERTIRIK